ncbi:Uncharacterised protein [Burkholderia pseudomallei]|nr:Uncharacterised protein [Burkholderia pseudomallei]
MLDNGRNRWRLNDWFVLLLHRPCRWNVSRLPTLDLLMCEGCRRRMASGCMRIMSSGRRSDGRCGRSHSARLTLLRACRRGTARLAPNKKITQIIGVNAYLKALVGARWQSVCVPSNRELLCRGTLQLSNKFAPRTTQSRRTAVDPHNYVERPPNLIFIAHPSRTGSGYDISPVSRRDDALTMINTRRAAYRVVQVVQRLPVLHRRASQIDFRIKDS